MNPVRNAGFVSGGNQYPGDEDRRHNRRWRPRPPQGQPQPFQPVHQYPSGLQVHTTSMPAPAQITVPVHGHGQYNNIPFPPGGMFYPSISPASQVGGFLGPVIFNRYQAEGPRIPAAAPFSNISCRPEPAMLYSSIPPASKVTGIIHPPNHRYQAEEPRIPFLPRHQEEGVPPHHESETHQQQEADVPETHQQEEAEVPETHQQQAETPPTDRVVLTPEITKVPLKKMITGVVEYWFSPANLIRDDYLKARMDEEGWVPISFINTFPGLQIMNIDPFVVAENMRDSSQAEVRMEDLMIRKRGDWFNYLPQHP